VSVRKGDSGYTTHIYVTIKATGADLASIEEAKERYNKSAFTCDMMANRLYYNTRSLNYGDYKELSEEEQEKIYTEYVKKSIENFNKINVYHTERKRYFEMTTKFYNKVLAVYKIANQWNYDNSDSMTDYYDVGYYLTINIETNSAKARETMTEEERATLDDLKKRLHPCALNEAGERLQFFSGNNLIIDYHKTSPEIIILSL